MRGLRDSEPRLGVSIHSVRLTPMSAFLTSLHTRLDLSPSQRPPSFTCSLVPCSSSIFSPPRQKARKMSQFPSELSTTLRLNAENVHMECIQNASCILSAASAGPDVASPLNSAPQRALSIFTCPCRLAKPRRAGSSEYIARKRPLLDMTMHITSYAHVRRTTMDPNFL